MECEYKCGHCEKPNPELLAYKGSNCCAECFKVLDYYVVYDDDEGFVCKLTILLTKKSAERWILYDDGYKKKIYRNLRIITTTEYKELYKIKDKHLIKKEIYDIRKRLCELESEFQSKYGCSYMDDHNKDKEG